MDKCSGVALNPRSLQERKETQTKGNARKSPVALGGNWMAQCESTLFFFFSVKELFLLCLYQYASILLSCFCYWIRIRYYDDWCGMLKLPRIRLVGPLSGRLLVLLPSTRPSLSTSLLPVCSRLVQAFSCVTLESATSEKWRMVFTQDWAGDSCVYYAGGVSASRPATRAQQGGKIHTHTHTHYV